MCVCVCVCVCMLKYSEHYDKKDKTVMVNNSTNINKTCNHES